MNYNNFSQQLIEWYELCKRDLPWRNTKNPYLIWISEIILQQTRVIQGLPYYLKFAEQFPTLKDLANAPEKDVLRLWQGLGYYSRARNMLKSAIHIHEELNGEFPGSFKELIKLKGIGRYTAGAIASFAYGELVPVVDGNVMRVLARIFGIYEDISTQKGQKAFVELAEKLLPETQSDIFNQALMEFGATWCTPKLPKCGDCIFNKNCHAFQKDVSALLPVKNSKLVKKLREISFFVIKHRGKLLMNERTKNDIWRGLYQFYSREIHLENIRSYLPDPLLDKILLHTKYKITIPLQVYKHILTHQVITAKFWEVELHDPIDDKDLEPLGLNFYSLGEVNDLPKPVLIDNYLRERYF